MNNSFYDSCITKISITPPPWKLTEKHHFFFAGSCFADNLYNSLSQRHLKCSQSPYGNMYNPISIAKGLKSLKDAKSASPEFIVNNDGLYRHFDFHTKIHDQDKHQLLNKINSLIQNAHTLLKSASVLIITLGTAWVFEKDGVVVNNCHKLPGRHFTRRLLSIDEITLSLKEALTELKMNNPGLKTVITLSPVRHLRDSFTDNSLSKAVLRVAAQEISMLEDTWYFPSYEIVIDELRDYRWYDTDLVHPGKKAVDYIVDLFLNNTADERLVEYIRDIDAYLAMKNHKIMLPESDSAKKFCLSLKKKKQFILNKYPDIKLQ